MTVKEQAINAIEKLIPEDDKILFGSPKISVSEEGSYSKFKEDFRE